MKKILIPSPLLWKCLKQRSIKKLQIWLWLQFNTAGHVSLTTDVLNKIAEYFELSVKTIRRYLRYLITKNWLGYNESTGVLYLRSIRTILKSARIVRRYAYSFQEKNLFDLKYFAFACLVQDVISQKCAKEKEQPYRRGRHFKFSSFAISSSYLSKRFGFGVTFIKSLIKGNPFIKSRKNEKPMLTNGRTIKGRHIRDIREHTGLQAIKVNKKGVIVHILPNILSTTVKGKKRRT